MTKDDFASFQRGMAQARAYTGPLYHWLGEEAEAVSRDHMEREALRNLPEECPE